MTLHEAGLEAALLPCPHCGSDDVFVQNAGWKANTFMRCRGCKTTFSLDHNNSHDNTVAAWNRRASLPAPQGPVAIKGQNTDKARKQFKLWFFRDVPENIRLKLFGLMMYGITARELETHMAQSSALTFCLDALTAPQPPSPDTGGRPKLIEHMVDRFLSWKLPEPFRPDGGIYFEPRGNPGTEHEYKREPTGTNLLDATQARAMVTYMLDGFPTEATYSQAEYDEVYEIGKRDGYEEAVQEIDLATGGDGEFKGSTFPGETVDVPVMKARIIERCSPDTGAQGAESVQPVAYITADGLRMLADGFSAGVVSPAVADEQFNRPLYLSQPQASREAREQ